MGNKSSKPIDKIPDATAAWPNKSVAFNLQTIWSNVPGEPSKSDEMAQLIEDLEKHTIQYASKLRREVVVLSVNSFLNLSEQFSAEFLMLFMVQFEFLMERSHEQHRT